MYYEQGIESFYRSKVISLSNELESSIKIYLDTKYWIHLRDYILGRSKVRQMETIYNLLLELSTNSLIVCPTSQYIFFELLKQDDISTRDATAKIIDELSRGIVTAEEEMRIANEIKHYFDSRMYEEENVFPLRSLIWTKTVYLFGVKDPYLFELSEEQNLEIQKAFIEEVWTYNYQQVLDFLNKMKLPIPDDKPLVEAFNFEKNKSPVGNIEFEKLSYFEFKGLLNFYKDKFESLLDYHRKVFKCKSISINNTVKISNFNELIEFLLEQEKNNIINTELPFFKIRAGILAAIRMDPKRKFKLTDFKDWGHASVALPYFDYFFTDNSLNHLLSNKPLLYDKKFNCEIHSSFDSVLNCLKSIRKKV